MRNMLILGAAIASFSPCVNMAAAASEAQPQVRPDKLLQVQTRPPPWAECRRWDARTVVCRDPSWRGRNWRAWYGPSTCRVRGHGWWIDRRGLWRRC